MNLSCCLLIGAATFFGCSESTSPIVQPIEQQELIARLPAELQRKTISRKPNSDDWFQNVTQDTGVNFSYRSAAQDGNYQLLESIGGGVTFLDYDLDGDQDFFTTGGGSISGEPLEVQGRSGKLFRNNGNFKFTDVTTDLGLESSSLFGHGCNSADFNRDGWPDLIITGYGKVLLYQNNQGNSFSDITTESGLANCNSWNIHSAWVDLDNDGWLDLYIVTYADWQPDSSRNCNNDRDLKDVCGPTIFNGAQDLVFHNQQNGTFKNITTHANIVKGNRGLGVITLDFNQDGFVDVFVGNDVEENQLYLGSKEMVFTEEGVVSGVAFSATGEREATMGISLGDINSDGLPDLWYTNYSNQDNSLYQMTGPASFISNTESASLAGVSRKWVGFGTVISDFNLDNWPDIFVSNGHVAYDRRDSPYYQPPQLFMNKDKGRKFPEISEKGGPYFDGEYSGRGAAVADLNNDGSMDLVVVHQDEPVAILKNKHVNDYWIRLYLKGTDSNNEAIGAKVTIEIDGQLFTQWVKGSDSYNSNSDRRILFSLPSADSVEVAVLWPSGITETFSNIPVNTTYELIEGMGR